MFQRVEVEFLSGSEGIRDRRTFEKVTTIEFVPESHLRIVSMDDGELIVKWHRLEWYHTQPLDKLGVTLSMDEQILSAMADAAGGHSNYLNGIRKRRELTGEGLKEAKEYVEQLRGKHGL